MIDPHAAGVAHVGAQGGDERREAAGDQRLRREGGEAPVLALRIEHVGRRADAEAGQELVRIGADLRAAAVEADGEIADQADPHAGVLGRLLRRGERAVGQPLQEGVVARIAAVAGLEGDMAGEALAAVAE